MREILTMSYAKNKGANQLVLLTLLSQMEFPTLIKWTSHLVLRVVCLYFSFFANFNTLLEDSADPDQTASDLDLHCLLMSQKKGR